VQPGRPAVTLGSDSPEARRSKRSIGESAARDVIVIFRNGSRKPLQAVAFAPGTKVCTRGPEVMRAVEAAGGTVILQTVAESEQLLQRGICDAMTASQR
jgi:hypothetical protein